MFSSNGSSQGSRVANSIAAASTTNNDSLYSASSDFSISQSILLADLGHPPCLKGLVKLRTLQDGWDGEGSLAIENDALASAAMILVLVPELHELIRVYPTFEGGVLLEYITTDWSYSVEVAPTGTVAFCGVEIEGSDEFDLEDFQSTDYELLTKIRNTIC